MRFTTIIFASIATSASLLSGQSEQKESDTTALKKKVADLERRMENNDYSALAEARELPPEIGIRFLLEQAHYDPENRERGDRALLELRQVHGVRAFFERELAAHEQNQKDPTRLFAALTAIGNDEAAELVAPYLFDFRKHPEIEGMDAGPFCLAAASALGNMQLSDTPTTKAPSRYKADDYIAWQKWAIKRGFVPEEWRSRIGLPADVARFFALLSGEVRVPTPESVSTQSAATDTARATAPPIPVPAASTPSDPHYVWLGISGVLLLSAACLFAYSRRSHPTKHNYE